MTMFFHLFFQVLHFIKKCKDGETIWQKHKDISSGIRDESKRKRRTKRVCKKYACKIEKKEANS